MVELVTRAYQVVDALALANLLNAVSEHAGGHAGVTGDEVESFVSTLVPAPGTDSRLVFAGDLLVAAAMNAPPPVGGFRLDLIGGVRPDWRGRGLGRELFAWQLRRAEQMYAEARPDAPWQAQAHAGLDDHDAIRLFQRFGLAPMRYWLDMVAETAGASEPEPPAGLTMTAFEPAHEASVHAAHMEAFTDHWGYQYREFADWVELTVRLPQFLPQLSRVAFDGAEVAGYLLAYADPDPKRVYVGQLGVRRPWRRRGLAGTMLADVLHSASQAGHTSAALGVDADSLTGAVGIYERAGFRVDHRAVTYTLALAT